MTPKYQITFQTIDFSDVTLCPEDGQSNCTSYEDFSTQDPVIDICNQDDYNLPLYSLSEFLNLHSSNLSLPSLVKDSTQDFEILSVNTSAFQDELRHLSNSRRLTLDRSFFLMKSEETQNPNHSRLNKVLRLEDLLVVRMERMLSLDLGFIEKMRMFEIVQTKKSPLVRSRRLRKSIQKTARKTVKTMGRVRKISNKMRRVKKSTKKNITKILKQVVGGFCKLLRRMF